MDNETSLPPLKSASPNQFVKGVWVFVSSARLRLIVHVGHLSFGSTEIDICELHPKLLTKAFVLGIRISVTKAYLEFRTYSSNIQTTDTCFMRIAQHS